MDRRVCLKGICAVAATSALSCQCGKAIAQTVGASPQVCTEIEIENLDVAFSVATAEFQGNHPGANRTQAAALLKKKWNPRRKLLNVDFLTEPPFIDKVIANAKLWQPYMGISFQFGRGSPNILVAFEVGGSWSDIGTDSTVSVSQGAPSMNLGWFGAETADAEFTRTTVHEFGHALGLIHEHSHPGVDIPWNETNVFAYYEKLGWGPDKVRKNIFKKYDASQLNFSSYDRSSIMHYSIPREFVLDEKFAMERPWILSALDKQFVASNYPKTPVRLP